MTNKKTRNTHKQKFKCKNIVILHGCARQQGNVKFLKSFFKADNTF